MFHAPAGTTTAAGIVSDLWNEANTNFMLTSKKGDGKQYAGLETQAIVRRELFKEIQTVGKIDYNESRVEFISARIDGRVDRLYVGFTGIEVKENDHLVDLYSPELYSAQAELIAALEASETHKSRPGGRFDDFAESNLLASREKLRLLGLLREEITEFEKTGRIGRTSRSMHRRRARSLRRTFDWDNTSRKEISFSALPNSIRSGCTSNCTNTTLRRSAMGNQSTSPWKLFPARPSAGP